MSATPARKQPPPRQAPPQKEKSYEVHLTVDGKLYVFAVDDASAEDAAALRRATGLSLNGLLNAAMEDLDIDVVAALVWLVRRRDEPRLRYEAVAREISYETPIEWENPNEAKDSRIRAVGDPDEDGGLDPTNPAS